MSIEKKYPIAGYAPGKYHCNCVTCTTFFLGDKRATQCEPCAEKTIAPPPPALTGKTEELTELDCKRLIFYGENKGIVIDDPEWKLDWAISMMFHMLKEHTVFDAEMAEKVFWRRIQALTAAFPATSGKSDEEIFYDHFNDEEMSEGFVELKTKKDIKQEILAAMAEARQQGSHHAAKVEIPKELEECGLTATDRSIISQSKTSNIGLMTAVEETMLEKFSLFLRERDEMHKKTFDGFSLLLKLNEDYIKLLNEELDEVVPIAGAHGWKSDRFEHGKMLREKIRIAKHLMPSLTDTKTTSHEGIV